MKEVYITTSAFRMIIKDITISEYLHENLPKYERLKLILSRPEIEQLIKYSKILEDFKNFSKYEKRDRIYSNDPKKRWVFYKEKPPSYHLVSTCTHLVSNYENFSIPVEINEKDIEEYRSFFIENIDLYRERSDVFFARAELKFNTKIKNIKVIRNENSGITEVRNHKIESPDIILTRINNLINEMENYRASDSEKKILIKKVGFGTDRAKYLDKDGNYVLYIDDKNSPIYHWHQYKKELKLLIEKYFISTLNPEFSFSKNILEQCGLSCCRTCLTNQTHLQKKEEDISF